MKYYLLERSLKRKDVGIAFGQTKELWDGDKDAYGWQNMLEALPEYHGNLRNDKFPDFEPRIKFELSEKGKLTDLVDIPNMRANGMLISPKFRDLLERFNLMEHRFYEGVVKAGVFYREYFWFHPLNSYYQWLDYDKSEVIFEVNEDHPVKITNKDEFKKRLGKGYFRNEKLVFNKSFPEYDLFYVENINFFNSFFISEPLMKAIKKEKITGIEIKEQDVFGDL